MKKINTSCLIIAIITLGFGVLNVSAQNTIAEAIQQVTAITHPDPYKQNELRAEEAKKIIMARIETTNPNLTDPPKFKDKNDKMDLFRDGDKERGIKPAVGDELINWCWENKAGRCDEQLNLMKKILEASGVKVEVLAAGNHTFPVVNMDKDAAYDIPWSWGPHAISPDTWLRKTLKPEDSWKEPYHFDNGNKKVTMRQKKTTLEYLQMIGPYPEKIDNNCEFELITTKTIKYNYRTLLNNYFKFPEEIRKGFTYRPSEDKVLEAGQEELAKIRDRIEGIQYLMFDDRKGAEIIKVHSLLSDLDGRMGLMDRCADELKSFRKKIKETYKLIPKLTTDATLGVSDTGLDEVPDDISKNTGQVKVDQYFVLLLTNASHGLYISTIDGIKTAVRCSFEGGGINCKPTDLVTYKKLLGPFATRAEAQEALCQSITETRYFPLGVGLKGRWQGGNTWYGLWNASVSGCPSR